MGDLYYGPQVMLHLDEVPRQHMHSFNGHEVEIAGLIIATINVLTRWSIIDARQ